MHSFGPSRGRIFFETLCALTISASLVGAWMQTGAWALLVAAGVSALCGLVHPLGRKARPVAVAHIEEPAAETAGRIELDVSHEGEAQPLTNQEPATEEVSKAVEPAAAKAAAPRAKAPRKTGARRTSSPKKAKLIELARPTEAEVAHPEEIELPEFMSPEEASHPHIEPLFEPAPFVRMPQRAFGRKA